MIYKKTKISPFFLKEITRDVANELSREIRVTESAFSYLTMLGNDFDYNLYSAFSYGEKPKYFYLTLPDEKLGDYESVLKDLDEANKKLGFVFEYELDRVSFTADDFVHNRSTISFKIK